MGWSPPRNGGFELLVRVFGVWQLLFARLSDPFKGITAVESNGDRLIRSGFLNGFDVEGTEDLLSDRWAVAVAVSETPGVGAGPSDIEAKEDSVEGPAWGVVAPTNLDSDGGLDVCVILAVLGRVPGMGGWLGRRW